VTCLDIDVLCTGFVWCVFMTRKNDARSHVVNKRRKPDRFGKRKGRFDSPRRVVDALLRGSVYFR